MSKTIKIMGAGVPEEKVIDMIAEAILENDIKKHPVGCILFTDQNVNPATYMGFGTWELWGSGMVPIGVDTNNSAINAGSKTTGSATASIAHTHSTPAISSTTAAASGNTGATTLALSQVPAHSHWVIGSGRSAHVTIGDNTWGWNDGVIPQSANTAGTHVTTDVQGGGGSHTHTLNSHTHTISVSAGTTGAASTTSVSVVQPSIACYMWKRVA